MDEENLQTFVHILGLLDGLKASLAQSMHALSVVTSMTDLSEQISLEAFGEGSVPMTLTRYPTLAGARSRISRLATSTKTTFSPNIGSEQLSADLEPVGAFASGTATSAGSPRTKPRAAFDVKGSDLLKNLIENASSESLGGKDVSASHDSDILSVMDRDVVSQLLSRMEHVVENELAVGIESVNAEALQHHQQLQHLKQKVLNATRDADDQADKVQGLEEKSKQWDLQKEKYEQQLKTNNESMKRMIEENRMFQNAEQELELGRRRLTQAEERMQKEAKEMQFLIDRQQTQINELEEERLVFAEHSADLASRQSELAAQLLGKSEAPQVTTVALSPEEAPRKRSSFHVQTTDEEAEDLIKSLRYEVWALTDAALTRDQSLLALEAARDLAAAKHEAQVELLTAELEKLSQRLQTLEQLNTTLRTQLAQRDEQNYQLNDSMFAYIKRIASLEARDAHVCMKRSQQTEMALNIPPLTLVKADSFHLLADDDVVSNLQKQLKGLREAADESAALLRTRELAHQAMDTQYGKQITALGNDKLRLEQAKQKLTVENASLRSAVAALQEQLTDVSSGLNDIKLLDKQTSANLVQQMSKLEEDIHTLSDVNAAASIMAECDAQKKTMHRLFDEITRLLTVVTRLSKEKASLEARMRGCGGFSLCVL